MQTLGSGSPAIVLDAGFQSGWDTWGRVAAELAPLATVFVLDRSSLLLSAPRSLAIDPDQAALQLHQLLASAGSGQPIVPVGWSLGGIYARSFAAGFPAGVTGLVLVEHVTTAFLHEVRALTASQRTSDYCSALLKDIDAVERHVGPGAFALPATSEQPVLPVTHIVRSSPPPPEDLVALRWVQLQRQSVRSSTALREIVAGRSGYAIPLDRPDVIADAVRALIARSAT